MIQDKEDWDIVVKPKTNILSFNFKEIWSYKDLILLLVRRDLTTIYKQTLLGPVWIIAHPIITTLMYTFTLTIVAGLKTQGIPAFLYYITGLTFWNYFAECLNKNAHTFSANASIFGKVYFPRLVMPISMLISTLLKLAIQLGIYVIIWLYFIIANGTFQIHLETFYLLPIIILTLGIMGLSIGLIITSLTTKYRDFNFLIGYFVQFLMFASCIVLVLPKEGKLHDLLMFNPIVPLIEAIKQMFLGVGNLSYFHLGYSFLFTILLFIVGIIVFNKTEKTFMDTV